MRVRLMDSLGRLVAGGRSLTDALEDLRTASRDARLTDALAVVGQGLREGALLADAAALAPGLFTPGERGLLEVGERTGRLPLVLARIAAALSRRAEVQRRLWRAAAYPAFLLTMAALSMPLPCLVTSCGPRGYLLRAGSGLAALAAAGILAALAPAAARRFGLGASIRRFAWSAPVLRSLYRPRVRAEALNAAAIGLSSGLGLPETLRLAGIASADPSAADACREIARRVEGGSELAAAIGATDLLPPADLISVTGGERGGDLDIVLARLGDESLAAHVRRTDLAMRISGWVLLVATLGILAVRILGQAQSVTGVPDDVLRLLERESQGVFLPLR